nr:hypothetical protein CFP56_21679 [Quercus suber]
MVRFHFKCTYTNHNHCEHLNGFDNNHRFHHHHGLNNYYGRDDNYGLNDIYNHNYLDASSRHRLHDAELHHLFRSVLAHIVADLVIWRIDIYNHLIGYATHSDDNQRATTVNYIHHDHIPQYFHHDVSYNRHFSVDSANHHRLVYDDHLRDHSVRHDINGDDDFCTAAVNSHVPQYSHNDDVCYHNLGFDSAHHHRLAYNRC